MYNYILNVINFYFFYHLSNKNQNVFNIFVILISTIKKGLYFMKFICTTKLIYLIYFFKVLGNELYTSEIHSTLQ